MAQQVFDVEGMSCGHCESAVNEELGKLAGVSNVAASAEKGNVVFDNDGSATDEQIIAAIDEAGYDAKRADG